MTLYDMPICDFHRKEMAREIARLKLAILIWTAYVFGFGIAIGYIIWS
jgi:hypothetical protein